MLTASRHISHNMKRLFNWMTSETIVSVHLYVHINGTKPGKLLGLVIWGFELITIYWKRALSPTYWPEQGLFNFKTAVSWTNANHTERICALNTQTKWKNTDCRDTFLNLKQHFKKRSVRSWKSRETRRKGQRRLLSFEVYIEKQPFLFFTTSTEESARIWFKIYIIWRYLKKIRGFGQHTHTHTLYLYKSLRKAIINPVNGLIKTERESVLIENTNKKDFY